MKLLVALVLWAGAANAQVEVRDGDAMARFDGPTDRYGHAIMGDLPEWTGLCLSHARKSACITLPENAVFEDIAPRLADMDGDGVMEAVVVESTTTDGAALVVYQLAGHTLTRIATPPIGRRNRWLAPIGIADFDKDGRMDIAYVETPHLGKTIRVWSWDNGELVQVAAASGATNHRIGESVITSGLRTCAGQTEMVLPDASWQSVLAVRLEEGSLVARTLGPFGRDFAGYLKC